MPNNVNVQGDPRWAEGLGKIAGLFDPRAAAEGAALQARTKNFEAEARYHDSRAGLLGDRRKALDPVALAAAGYTPRQIAAITSTQTNSMADWFSGVRTDIGTQALQNGGDARTAGMLLNFAKAGDVNFAPTDARANELNAQSALNAANLQTIKNDGTFRVAQLGLDIQALKNAGLLNIAQTRPFEVSPGATALFAPGDLRNPSGATTTPSQIFTAPSNKIVGATPGTGTSTGSTRVVNPSSDETELLNRIKIEEAGGKALAAMAAYPIAGGVALSDLVTSSARAAYPTDTPSVAISKWMSDNGVTINNDWNALSANQSTLMKGDKPFTIADLLAAGSTPAAAAPVPSIAPAAPAAEVARAAPAAATPAAPAPVTAPATPAAPAAPVAPAAAVAAAPAAVESEVKTWSDAALIVGEEEQLARWRGEKLAGMTPAEYVKNWQEAQAANPFSLPEAANSIGMTDRDLVAAAEGMGITPQEYVAGYLGNAPAAAPAAAAAPVAPVSPAPASPAPAPAAAAPAPKAAPVAPAKPVAPGRTASGGIVIDGIPFEPSKTLAAERQHGDEYVGINAKTKQLEARYWDANKNKWSKTPVFTGNEDDPNVSRIKGEDTYFGIIPKDAAALSAAPGKLIEQGRAAGIIDEATLAEVMAADEKFSKGSYRDGGHVRGYLQSLAPKFNALYRAEAMKDPRVAKFASGDFSGDAGLPDEAMDLAEKIGINRGQFGIPEAGIGESLPAGLGAVFAPAGYAGAQEGMPRGLQLFFQAVQEGRFDPNRLTVRPPAYKPAR